jgi:hypothetical protein
LELPSSSGELFSKSAAIATGIRDLRREKANFVEQLFHISELAKTDGTDKVLSFYIQPDKVSKLTAKDERDIVGSYDQQYSFSNTDSNRKLVEFNSVYHANRGGQSEPFAGIRYSSVSKKVQKLLISVEVADRFILAAREASEKCGPTLIGVVAQSGPSLSDATVTISRIDLKKAK